MLRCVSKEKNGDFNENHSDAVNSLRMPRMPIQYPKIKNIREELENGLRTLRMPIQYPPKYKNP